MNSTQATTMTTTTTLSDMQRLAMAFQALARGFGGVGEGSKPVCVVRSAQAKLAIARNMRRVQEVLQPAQEELESLRVRLFAAEHHDNPGAKELSPARAEELTAAVRAMNAKSVSVELLPVTLEDIDIDRIEGEDGFAVLAVLDGTVIR